MKVSVTVELTFDRLPDDAARQLAREIVEGRGLEVSRVAIVAAPDRVKVFTPKAGKPGSEIVRDGRRYQVWSDGPYLKSVWAVPVERRDGDADCVLITGSGRPVAYHGNGQACASTWSHGVNFERIETPCQHASHAAEHAA